MESMHTVSCFVELYEDLFACGLAAIDRNEFERLLQVQIDHILTRDTSVWATEYVCKPSLFIHSRNSCFYAENKALCNFECSFISETQEQDGSWAVTWDWGRDPEQWHISKNWWKADLILKNRKFYHSMMGDGRYMEIKRLDRESYAGKKLIARYQTNGYYNIFTTESCFQIEYQSFDAPADKPFEEVFFSE